jgi:hypothetical protein
MDHLISVQRVHFRVIAAFAGELRLSLPRRSTSYTYMEWVYRIILGTAGVHACARV